MCWIANPVDNVLCGGVEILDDREDVAVSVITGDVPMAVEPLVVTAPV